VQLDRPATLKSHIRRAFGRRSPLEAHSVRPPNATIRVAVAADLTGSGRMDIVRIDERRGTFIHFNQPDGTFSPAVPLGTVQATPYALTVGDTAEPGDHRWYEASRNGCQNVGESSRQGEKSAHASPTDAKRSHHSARSGWVSPIALRI